MIISYQGKTPIIHNSVFVCEGAQIIGDVIIDKDCSVWFNAVIRGDVNYIRIGEKTNIQDGAILHNTYLKYPLIIGSNVTIGHGAIIHGCRISDNVLIGMGAILLDNSHIGSNSLIAAGTLIKEGFEVPENVLVAGVPGKIIRELKEDERKKIGKSAENYLMYVKNYKNS